MDADDDEKYLASVILELERREGVLRGLESELQALEREVSDLDSKQKAGLRDAHSIKNAAAYRGELMRRAAQKRKAIDEAVRDVKMARDRKALVESDLRHGKE